jgi:hypothetical protein
MAHKRIADNIPEITPEMIAAGEKAILETVGGADLGGYFSAPDLAIEVYKAMRSADLRARRCVLAHSPTT